MFEGILESVLNKILGQYIEGLNKNDLQISIWGGQVELQNIKLRKDIFQQFKLPLDMVFGQIGYLKVIVPWKNLSSSPVTVLIDNVQIVVRPRTDQSSWELFDQLPENDLLKLREDAIAAFAKQFFLDQIKTKEDLAKEQGMMSALITKIIDNLQVSLSKIHLRVENADPDEENNQFSMGITLQAIELYTTDKEWKRQFVDRSKQKQNDADLSIYKMLIIKNLGVYYKTKETNLLCAKPLEDIAQEMQTLSKIDKVTGKLTECNDYYLVEPISQEAKLVQNELVNALDKMLPLHLLTVELEKFSICLQKGQYDNIQMLLDLTSDYMRFINTATLKSKREKLNQMYTTLQTCGVSKNKASVKSVFLVSFVPLLEIILASDFDDKKLEKLMPQRYNELFKSAASQNDQKLLWGKLLPAIELDDLTTWTREVIEKRAEMYKKQVEEQKAQKKQQGFWGSMFGSKTDSKNASEAIALNQVSELLKEVKEISANEDLKKEIIHSNLSKRKDIPDFVVNFKMNQLQLTLVNDIQSYQGVQFTMETFKVNLKMFDASNKWQKHKLELSLSNKKFDMQVVNKNTLKSIDYSPFLQQLHCLEAEKNVMSQQIQKISKVPMFDAMMINIIPGAGQILHKGIDQMSFGTHTEEEELAINLFLALGNVNHQHSDLPDNEKSEIDLFLKLHLSPVEIIYQAHAVDNLTRFFKVKNLSAETKIAARAQFDQLSKQLGGMTADLNADFKRNKIDIKIEAPTLILPFDQTSKFTIEKSECWVFTVGDAKLKSVEQSTLFDFSISEGFEFKVEKMKFEYASNYLLWKRMQLHDNEQTIGSILASSELQIKSKENQNSLNEFRVVQILEDFTTSVLIIRKRSENEMETKAAIQKLRNDKSAELKVLAQFDTEMKFALKPEIFKMLIKIGDLFKSNEKGEDHYRKKMAKRIDQSKYYGKAMLLKNNIIDQYIPGTILLEKIGNIAFFDDRDSSWVTNFDIDGCLPTNCEIVGEQMLRMTNKEKEECVLQLTSEKAAKRWFEEVTELAKKLKTEQDIVLQRAVTQNMDAEESKDEEQDEFHDAVESKEVDNELIKFQFEFSAPKICLQLNTPKRGQSDWQLVTDLDTIKVSMRQHKHDMKLFMNVKSLQVLDNSGDERFPFIFCNREVEGQEELVSLFVQQINKSSPLYANIETKVQLGFGALEIFWKPKTMINLMHFLVDQAPKKEPQNRVVVPQIDLSESSDTGSVMNEPQKDVKPEQSQPQSKIKNCGQQPDIQIEINIKLTHLKAIFIHPQNNSYPIFTLEVQDLFMVYKKRCDCDYVITSLKNFLVFDNTNYPRTHDPFITYCSSDKISEQEILGVNKELTDGKPMLELELFAFTYPGADGSCINQNDKGFNLNIKVELQQIKLIYMQQCTLRLVDYTMVQVINLLVKNSKEPASNVFHQNEAQPKAFVNKIKKKDPFWESFDLKQSPFCVGLDVKIKSPLVVIPDLGSSFGIFNKWFELDLGTVKITSRLTEESNRWKYFPYKTLRMMQLKIENTDLKFDFRDRSIKQYKPIFHESKIDLIIQIPNASPFFAKEDSADYQGPLFVDKQGNMFDPQLVDSSMSISLEQKLFKLVFIQDVLTKSFELLENNFTKKDEFSDHFEVVLRNKRQLSSQNLSSVLSEDKKIQSDSDDEIMDKKPQKLVGFNKEFWTASSKVTGVVQPLENDFQKTMSLLFHFYCLSIELREDDNTLISEFCLLNTDLGYESFESGRSSVFLRAHKFFIFHDEDPNLQTKQVLMSHLGVKNIMVTDDNFYKMVPQTFRNTIVKAGTNKMDPDQLKIKFAVEIPSPKQTRGEMVIEAELKEIKLFLRLHVFEALSKFTIQGLEKLNRKAQKKVKPQEKQQSEVAQGSGKTRIQIKLTDSIVCIERKERTKKVLVVKMNAKIEMRSIDENFLKQQIENQMKQLWTNKQRYTDINDILVQVEEVTPYFIDWTELSETKFIQAKKRELITPISATVKLRTEIAPYFDKNNKATGEYNRRNYTSCNLGQIIIRVSIDDLYIINSVLEHVLKQANKITQVWNEYNQRAIDSQSLEQQLTLKRLDQRTMRLDDVKIVGQSPNLAQRSSNIIPQSPSLLIQTGDGKKTMTKMVRKTKILESEDSMSLMTTEDEPQGATEDSKIDFECKHAELIVINEYQGSFLPLILFQIEKVTFTQELFKTGLFETMEGDAETSCRMQYFNAPLGFWEPAIERFDIQVNLLGNGKAQKQKIVFTTDVNINVSVGLAGVLANFNNMWKDSTEKALKFEKIANLLDKENENSENRSVDLSFYSAQQLRHNLGNALGETNMLLGDKKDEEQFVTPYAIRNVTDMPIYVFTLINGEKSQDRQICIKPGQKKNIPSTIDLNRKVVQSVSFESEVNDFIEEEETQKKSSNESNSQANQLIRLEFFEKSMKPITRINLDQSNNTMIHRVFLTGQMDSQMSKVVEQQNLKNQKTPREFYVIQSSLENAKRVLTVRTQYTLTNKTDASYLVRIFWVDKENKKVKILHEVIIQPNDMTSIPDNPDLSLQAKMKICVKPNFAKKWSNEFKIQSLKEKANLANVNIIWEHDKTYSILRKERTDKNQVFNFVLLPAMIVKNCLPTAISIQVQQAVDINQIMKNQQQTSTYIPASYSDAVDNYELQKGEEKYLKEIQLTTNMIGVLVTLNKSFRSSLIKLSRELSEDCDIPIRVMDNFNKEFTIQAKIDTKKAGLRIVLYAKNCLISHTDQRLSFYYLRKPDLFKPDNSHQFPEPIEDGFKISSDGSEPTVYIFNETSKMVVSMFGQPRQLSNNIRIKEPGIREKFSISVDQNIFDFSCTVDIYQASPTEEVFTKVIEIAPHYIVCNLTTKRIKFCQSYVQNIYEPFKCINLQPLQRLSFNWSDGERDCLAKFIQDGNEFWSAAFTLSDAGTLAVQNMTDKGEKKFFNVTKKNQLGSIFIIIEDMITAPYLIDNLCEDVFAVCVQKGSRRVEEITDVTPLSKMPFAWTSQQEEHLMRVDFLYNGKQMKPVKISRKEQAEMSFSLDTLNTTQLLDLASGSERIQIYVSVYANEHSKVIEFSHVPSTNIFISQRDRKREAMKVEESKDSDDTFIIEEDQDLDLFKKPSTKSNSMNLSMKSLNLAFIKQGIELFTFNIITLQMSMLNTEAEQILELTIDRMQLDNMAQVEPLFPVVLKPRCTAPESQHNHDKMDDNVKQMFQFFMNMKTNVPKVTYITYFEFLLQTIELRMEINHIMAILEFLSDYNAESNVGLYSTHPIFFQQQKSSNQVSVEEESKDYQAVLQTWRSQTVAKEEGTIYIEKYVGHPILMIISVFKASGDSKIKKEKQNSKGAEIFDRLGGLGLNLTSINEAPLSLNALEIDNVYGPYNIVQDQLVGHYTSNIKSNVVKLLGSSDLIGNPVNFVNTLGTGAKEFFHEPSQGFMKGPIQGGIGIIKGTTSLVQHTIGGAAGSVGKITNSLNKGVLFLTFDDQYNKKKELQDIREKPKGAIDGLGKGLQGFGASLFYGITGIVTQPVQGAKQEGLLGFAKGMGRGVTGLVAKPLGGAVDIVVKTSLGIENGVNGGECAANNIRRRKPRAFYKHIKVFKDYNFLDSEIFFQLRNAEQIQIDEIRDKIDPNDEFYASFRLTKAGKLSLDKIDTSVLMLTKTGIFMLNKKLQFKWMRKHVDLVKFDINGKSLHIQFVAKAGLNGFGEIKQGDAVTLTVQNKVATYILHLEDEEKAKLAYDIFDEIKTLLTFERSQDL